MVNQSQIINQTPTLTNKNNFWQFKNSANDNNSVELRIDGDIIDDGDVWMYEWLGEPATAPNAFRKELANYAGKDLTVWIDSYGGSVFAGVGLYNALMNHKKTGATITTIGDGKVMSAATFPFSAGDKRIVTLGCLYMVHNPLAGAYGYASALRKTADALDIVKECIVNIYQATTGLGSDEISSMMEDETYMSAKSAVKSGFATEILQGQFEIGDVKNSLDNFSFNRLAVQNAAGDSMKRFFEVAQKRDSINNAKPNNSEENKEVKFVDIKQFKNEFPDLYNEIIALGVNQERDRMKALDDVQVGGFEDIVNKARYETGISAEQVALQIINAQKQLGSQYLNNRQEDVAASNLAQVPSTPAPSAVEQESTEIKAAAEKIAAAANEGRM